MPPPKKASRYPPDYLRMAEAALTQGKFVIPSTNPRQLRLYIQSYFRALEREGDGTFADALMVSVDDAAGTVTVKTREAGMHLDEISAALSGLAKPPPVSEAEAMAEALLSRLGKESSQ